MNAVVFFLLFVLSACSGQSQQAADAPSPPDEPGTLICLRSGNCVNSLPGSALPPLTFAGDPAQAMNRLRALLAQDKQAQVTRQTEQQLDVVFTTLLGFQDDVRFVLDGPAGRIHFRSMSRVGRYDFGKNGARMRDIAAKFGATKPRP